MTPQAWRDDVIAEIRQARSFNIENIDSDLFDTYAKQNAKSMIQRGRIDR